MKSAFGFLLQSWTSHQDELVYTSKTGAVLTSYSLHVAADHGLGYKMPASFAKADRNVRDY